MNRDYRRFKREQLLEQHGVTMEQYLEAIDISERLCEGIKNKDLTNLGFSDYEFRLLSMWCTIIENEKASMESKRTEN